MVLSSQLWPEIMQRITQEKVCDKTPLTWLHGVVIQCLFVVFSVQFYFEIRPLCVSSCFSVSPVCFSFSVFLFITTPVLFPPHSPHLFFFLSLVCLYIVFVLHLVIVSLFCDVLCDVPRYTVGLSCSWFPHPGLLFLTSPIWCVFGFGFLLIVLIWTLLFYLHFVFLAFLLLLCILSLWLTYVSRIPWFFLINLAFF